jgi:hypothetical protein
MLCGISQHPSGNNTKKLEVDNKLYYIFCFAQVVNFSANNLSEVGTPDCSIHRLGQLKSAVAGSSRSDRK